MSFAFHSDSRFLLERAMPDRFLRTNAHGGLHKLCIIALYAMLPFSYYFLILSSDSCYVNKKLGYSSLPQALAAAFP